MDSIRGLEFKFRYWNTGRSVLEKLSILLPDKDNLVVQ